MRPILSRKVLFSAALITVTAPLSYAGLMDPLIDLQTYRDFAENRGEFAAGATNVSVYDVNGTKIGTIDRVMNFDSAVDGGWSSLAGGASFLATVAHNGATNLTFTERFGATSGTPFYDSYHVIAYNRATDGGAGDYAIPRLNKIVTDAVAVPYLTDSSILTNLTGEVLQRVGGGTQDYAGPTSITNVAGGYAYLTGGTFEVTGVSSDAPTGSGDTNPLAYRQYVISADFRRPTADSPLSIGGRPGDSGSPSWYYNTNTARWEYVSSLGGGYGGAGFSQGTYYNFGNEWAVAMINSYNSPTITPTAGGGNITWNAPAANGTGTLTQGATNWSYIGLASTLRGATSTLAADGISTTAASDAQMEATRNLVFAGDGGTIELAASVDMGAGSLTFQNNYTLSDGGVSTRRLNSAGFIIGGGYTVTSNLTGAVGDEWRVVNDSINGATTTRAVFTIGGTGTNNADLNFGGNLLVNLNRTGGVAGQNVKINGGAVTVSLLGGANQIGGDVIFGHRGGTLDLHGNDLTADHITHLDSGANFANLKANSTSTYTYTGTGSQTYLGGFSDGSSLANGLLNINYNPGASAGSVWNLSGNIVNKGTWTVSSGEVHVAGALTLHAGGYVDPNDFVTAVFNTGTVTVSNGATFTAGAHAKVSSSVNVEGGGAFNLKLAGTQSERTYSGNVTLAATTSVLNSDTTDGAQIVTGNISGSGVIQKTGAGQLYLQGDNSSFSGTADIAVGRIRATSTNALGTGTWTIARGAALGVDNATFASVKARIDTNSQGTYALVQTGATRPDDNPVLTGYSNLFLGAIGTVDVGTVDTTNTLTGWNSDGGWNLGGGTGALNMNLKLVGNGTLVVGDGLSRGSVVLSNSGNTFSGNIVVNSGVTLSFTNTGAYGAHTEPFIKVNYGSSFVLGSSPASTCMNITSDSAGILQLAAGTDSTTLNFSNAGTSPANLPSVALGSAGTTTYSGLLTPGANGYKFGGSGKLTVSSLLTGANALSADGQGTNGGITTLTGTNDFSGGVTVQGGVFNGNAGSHTLVLGTASAVGSGNAVTINDGGTLDLNGFSLATGNLSGTAAGSLKNSSSTAVTLTVNQTGTTTMAGNLSGAFNLVKNGSGTLTLAGVNSQTGTVSVNTGTLRLGSNTAFSGGAVTVASGSTLDLNGYSAGTATVTLGGNSLINSSVNRGSLRSLTLSADTTISGASKIRIGSTSGANGLLNLDGYTLTKNGSGTLILNGVSLTGAGNIIINAGTLQLADDYGNPQRNVTLTGTGTITINSGAKLMSPTQSSLTVSMNIVLNGGTLGSTWPGPDGNTIASNIAVTADSTLNFDGGYDSVTLSGIISGTGNLTVNGDTGTHKLTNANTLTGNTLLTGGNLTLANTNALQNSTLSVGAGTALRFDSSVTDNAFTLGGLAGNGNFALQNNASTPAAIALTVGGNNADTTQSGVISGAGSLNKVGTGTLTLTGANTYSGGTTVTSGTLGFSNGSLGSGNVAMNGGALRWNTGNTQDISSKLTMLAGKTATLDTNGNTVTFATGIGDNTNAGLTKTGAGTLTLSGTNTYTGATNVNAGALILNGSLGDSAVTVASGATFGGPGTLGSSAATLNFQSGSNLLFTGGTLTLNGNLSFDGTTLLQFSSTPITNTEYTIVSYTGTLTNASNLTTAYRGTIDTGTGSNSVIKFTSGGTLALTWKGGTDGNWGSGDDKNNFVRTASPFTVENFYAGDTVTFDDSSSVKAVTLNGTLSPTAVTVNTTGTYTMGGSGSIAGATTLTKDGSGTLELNTTNTYTGDTTVNGGTLTIGGAGSLGSGAYAGVLSIASGALFNYASSANQTISSGITGSGNLTMGGSGTLTLTGANTYTGNTSVTAGTLKIGTGGSLGSGTYAGALALSSGATFNYAATTAQTISGVISGAGSLNVSSGRLTLTGANTTFTGGATTTGGVLRVTNINTASALGTGPLTLSGGGLAFNPGSTSSSYTISNAIAVTADSTIAHDDGKLTLSGNVSIATGATLTAGTAGWSGKNLTMSGVISGNGSLNIRPNGLSLDGYSTSGSGQVTLSGINTYTGSTTLQNGTLVIGGAGQLGSGNYAGAINLNGGTFKYGSTANQTFAGVISGGGNLAMDGTGTLTLTGTNTHTGTTSVSSGTLAIGGVGQLGSGSYAGAINLTGGTFNYASSANQMISGVIGGSGVLTKSGTGTLKLSGNNSGYSGATSVTAGTLVTANTAALGTGNVSVTGGTLQIGDGTTNGVTLGSAATLAMDANSTLMLAGADSKITMGSGAFTLTSGMNIDITNANLGVGNYTLIAGMAAGSTIGTWSASSDLVGGNLANFAYSFAKVGNNAVFTVTAVPEPTTYGLLGAASLAGAALVRRRRRRIVLP